MMRNLRMYISGSRYQAENYHHFDYLSADYQPTDDLTLLIKCAHVDRRHWRASSQDPGEPG